jgi:hypothetical protein
MAGDGYTNAAADDFSLVDAAEMRRVETPIGDT